MKKLTSWCVGAAGRRMALAGVGLTAATLLSSCVQDKDLPVDRTAMLQESDRVSNVPWNKPQGWEGHSGNGLGALANNPRIGGQQ